MKNLTFLMALLFLTTICQAQVGIGNTNPNATLDISASNSATPSNEDGILIPRIDEFPLTNPTNAQDGLMVFVTGSGTPTKGFYYWDSNTNNWNILTGGSSDADWYEESTTSSPSDIGDSIYTLGNVAIGRNTANSPLQIDAGNSQRGIQIDKTSAVNSYTQHGFYNSSNNTGLGGEIGIYNNLIGTGTGVRTGIFNNIIGNSGVSGYTGSYNQISGNGSNFWVGSYQSLIGSGNGRRTGSYNTISNSGNGQHYGVHNILNGTGSGIKYGTYNQVSNTGTNPIYGTYNSLSGSSSGIKYGSYNRIPTATGGTHYGVYSDVTKTGSFAGYFLGAVSIGTTSSNNYTLPSTRGTANQVMQTDGTGAVTWSNLAGDTDWVESGNNIYKTNGNVSIGTTFVPYKLYVTDNDPSNTSVVGLNNSYTGSGSVRSFNNVLTHTGTGTAQSYALFSYFNKPPGTANSGDTTANYGYAYNRYGGGVSSDSYGAYNIGFKSGGTSGDAYGTANFAYNEFGNTSYGVYATASGSGVNYAGYFVGDIFVGGSYIPSAAKLKRNVLKAPSSIDRLKSINIHEYQYKNDSYDYMHLPTGLQTGFIAEEFGVIFPELTKKTIQPKAAKELVEAGIERDHGAIEFTAVNYTGLIPHLVSGFQEQQATIEQQNEKIKLLEDKLLALEKKIQGR